MESKHTSEPWEVQRPGTNSITVTSKNRSYPICIIYKWPFVDPEAMANAKLISKAPELLEALKRVVYITEIEDAHLSAFGEFSYARKIIREIEESHV
jgi:hypothetical protein